MLRSTRSTGAREPLAAKVPEITVLFWVIKVLTTGRGESFPDHPGNGNPVLAGGCAFALWLQFRVRRFLAPVHWFAVLLVAVLGTAAADVLHVAAHISYVVSTTGYAVVLAAVLIVWRRSEGTLSIHSITTRRRAGSPRSSSLSWSPTWLCGAGTSRPDRSPSRFRRQLSRLGGSSDDPRAVRSGRSTARTARAAQQLRAVPGCLDADSEADYAERSVRSNGSSSSVHGS